MSQTVTRLVTFTSTGPSAGPSRLGDLALNLSNLYSQMTTGEIRISTSQAVTLNFQGLTVAQLVVLAADGRLKVRQNGNSAVALGLTSSLSSARLMIWEGSTTGLVLSNTSTATKVNLQYLLAGR